MKAILGYKRGMSRVFTATGEIVPVTVIEAGPCIVTQVKTQKKDGYSAVQLGFGDVPEKRLNKPERGHLKASGSGAVRHLREFRPIGDGAGDLAVGAEVNVGVFAEGDVVDVIGTSKGLGWQGVIRRHNFKRQRKTHGQSDRERAPGSVGAGTTPGKTFKGHRMAGRMGGERVTIKNLRVVHADPERNLLAVRGAVPGKDGTLVIVQWSEGKWE